MSVAIDIPSADVAAGAAEPVAIHCPCDACGGTVHRRLWTLSFPHHPKPFELWRCRGCGLVFNYPRLSAEELSRQYGGDYYVFSQPDARRWSRAVQLYTEYLLPVEDGGAHRLLDVGCGRGDLLAIARSRGWDVHGIELSAEASQSARDDLNLPVRTGTLEQHEGELGDFDVVISTEVIEHVPSPRSFLTSIRSLLRPRGQAIIETPNWGSFWRRLGGRRWLGLNQFHVYLFDAACLTRLMRACGFGDCRAASSTHVAYCEWGHRPELQPAIRRLPAGLRWRTERWLNRFTPSSPAVRLARRPPQTLDEAVARVQEFASEEAHYRTRRPSHRADNLAVFGYPETPST
jgi:2-polyprenyl-3-methyl-5-hydroxy-6-metoxy-1,4-benzoquinol methylase